jgi:hypothetical protein
VQLDHARRDIGSASHSAHLGEGETLQRGCAAPSQGVTFRPRELSKKSLPLRSACPVERHPAAVSSRTSFTRGAARNWVAAAEWESTRGEGATLQRACATPSQHLTLRPRELSKKSLLAARSLPGKATPSCDIIRDILHERSRQALGRRSSVAKREGRAQRYKVPVPPHHANM